MANIIDLKKQVERWVDLGLDYSEAVDAVCDGHKMRLEEKFWRCCDKELLSEKSAVMREYGRVDNIRYVLLRRYD